MENMVRKLARYAVLSFVSFFFFSAVLHTAAYAQAPAKPYVQELPALSEQTLTQVEPTLTILVSPAMTSTTTQAEEIKTATPPPAPQQKTPPLTHPTTIPSPTPTTAPTATPTPLPTKAVPTPTAIPTVTPTPPVSASVTTTTGGLDPEKLFSMANTHRQALGLPAFQKDERTCSLAAARSTEIAAEMAAGTLHSGMYGRNLPYWNTENAIALPSEEAAFNWWLNDGIHRQAIEGNKTYSCVACSGKYCVQEFTSYQPK